VPLRRPTASLVAASTVVATLTILFAMLVLGIGPGSEATRYAIADNYGINVHGVLLLTTWAAGVIAAVRLHRRR
jgi:hypothetical protein